MFGSSRVELAAELHRELRALHSHFQAQLDGVGPNSVGLQAPVCWPRAPPELILPTFSPITLSTKESGRSSSSGWNGWQGGWIGGSLGGSVVSGMAVLPLQAHSEHVIGASAWRDRPHFRILRPAPVGDVVAVILKGEWPKLNMDVSSIERDLHHIIQEPNPYVCSRSSEMSVSSGSLVTS